MKIYRSPFGAAFRAQMAEEAHAMAIYDFTVVPAKALRHASTPAAFVEKSLDSRHCGNDVI